MLEIDKAAIDRIETDAQIINYLHVTATDSRLYSWNPSFDIVYSESNKAAIFYHSSLIRRGIYSYPNQIQNMLFYLRVVGLNKTLVNQISERLLYLFDDKGNNSLITANYDVKKIDLSMYSDGDVEGTTNYPLYTKNISFSFSNIFKRT